MLPYLPPPSWQLGPLPVHAFGILVVLGCLLGARATERHASRTGLPLDVTRRLVNGVLVGGFLGAHWFDLVVYTPERLARDPLAFFEVWSGISSYGGFLGGLAAMCIVLRRARQPILPYADSLARGLSIGWVFGRAGCTLAHDHVGRQTSFLLGIQYPAGNALGIGAGARHNLGLYELLLAIVLALVLAGLTRRARAPGQVVSALVILYAPVRFALDGLRATDVPGADPRFLGLTAGQVLSVGALLAGVLVARHSWRRSGPSRSEEDPRSLERT